ncbi:hypothetical protein CRUP_003328 [Coryphaenoides rupestris]|nr:hypothetical protein CRUP_003328 [Coryphaenoides rupestris]
MTGGQGLIPLALLCLWLCHDALAWNRLPCQRARKNNGFDKFKKHHIRQDTPKGLDQNQWMAYILKLGWNRHTQSFLNYSELEQVKAVCSAQGGRRFRGNLCISMKPFTFTTVCSDVDVNTNTCVIHSIKRETKHLILACDRLDNQCLPVHFEGNRENAEPDKYAKRCESRQSAAAGLRAG